MALEERLAAELIRLHPERAASVLERVSVADAIRVLSRAAPGGAAELVRRLSPQTATAVLDGAPPAAVATILEALPVGVASRLARRLAPERLDAVLEPTSERTRRAIRSMGSLPENSAGALMDPNVLALPEDLSAKEALDRVRQSLEDAEAEVYVVDQDQRLVGALELLDLLRAAPRARLSDLPVRRPRALEARADRSVVLEHPGWKDARSLPVVDEQGCYLGAVRYRTVRELEALLLRPAGGDGSTHEALGQLFAIGAGGLLEALASPAGGGAGGRSPERPREATARVREGRP